MYRIADKRILTPALLEFAEAKVTTLIIIKNGRNQHSARKLTYSGS